MTVRYVGLLEHKTGKLLVKVGIQECRAFADETVYVTELNSQLFRNTVRTLRQGKSAGGAPRSDLRCRSICVTITAVAG